MTKTFPGVTALESVDLTVRAGTVHALCGENGAGKSTLMNVLAGLVQPDAGEIELAGEPVRFATPSEAMRAGISMIQQELHPVPARSVMENIWLGRFPRGRFGLVDHDRHAPRHPPAVPRHRHRARPRCPGRRPVGLPGPAHGDRPRGLVRRAHRDHGRAHLVALRARGPAPVRDHRRPAGQGRRGHLHLAQARRGHGDLRRGLDHARRADDRHVADVVADHRPGHHADGRPGPDRPLPGPPRDAGRGAARGRRADLADPGLVPGRLVPAAPGRGPGHRRPRGRPAHRARGGHLRPARRSRRARSGSTAARQVIRSPIDAKRLGMALLTEDRRDSRRGARPARSSRT